MKQSINILTLSKYLIFSFLLVFYAHTTDAQITLPGFFSDHMVVQRDQNINIWGWANANERVEVKFGNETKKTRAGSNGEWKVSFAPKPAGGPYSITINGKNDTKVLNDIWMGDVWICSGQSNMEWTVKQSDNAKEEIVTANMPLLRHVTIPNSIAIIPQNNTAKTEWKVCDPINVPDFSAVGYYFGKNLVQELGVPIGLINTSWGGTHVETWISRKAFEAHPHFKDMISGLPVLNLDSLKALNEKKTTELLQKVQTNFNPSAEEVAKWKDPAFDDSKWPSMKVPQLWENDALPNVDGVVWLRTSFTLGKDLPSGVATLYLSKIDDSDITYVNGVEVGGLQNQYSQDRIYTFSVEILKKGINTIAVRVEDTGGGGGIYGDPSNIKLVIGKSVVPLDGNWKFQVESLITSAQISPNRFPTLLYNAMIHPLLPYSIKGSIWYQGESNAGRAKEYQISFPLLIQDWRNKWGSDFPFFFVQLASYNANNGNSNAGSAWAELREAQTFTATQVPNTGMAITTDIGDPLDIHPRNKSDVGKRLAALALDKTYGLDRVSEGPAYSSMAIDGKSIKISFEHIDNGLMTTDKYGYVKGFEIAGEDQVFHYAKAEINGDQVVVHSTAVPKPVAVRFGWADDASDCNLFNADSFPAVPFRTDDWKSVTEGISFSFE